MGSGKRKFSIFKTTFCRYRQVAPTNKINRTGKIVLLISATLFIISLTQTALIYNDFDAQKSHSSISLLIMGGFAILGGGLPEWIIWLANPLYIIAIFKFIKNKKTSIYFSVIGAALALSFSTWHEILAAENGRTATIAAFKNGYWLWTFSIMTLAIGTIISFKQTQSVPSSSLQTFEKGVRNSNSTSQKET